MSKIIWKKIENYPDYFVNKKGEIKSTKQNKVKILKQNISNGYLIVGISRNNKSEKKRVHRLVARAFVKNKLKKDFVNHIDGNKTNNNYDNLEWCTSKENTAHGIKIGVINLIGENNKMSKLKSKDVLFIKEAKISAIKLSNKFKVSWSLIYKIKRNELWKHL